MAELRYNPLLEDWTMVAANRQNRPAQAGGTCPFCPGSGKVPQSYDVYAYENDFPVLSPLAPLPDPVAGGPYRALPAYGKCEVILYSPNHEASLPTLSVDHIGQLIDVWTERMQELKEDPRHRYIMIFENRGAEVGATMSHPHGQIYCLPYVPLKLRREILSSERYYQVHRRCLFCDMTAEEERFGGRMLIQSEEFSSYLPFFTDYPYGAFIVPRAHVSSMLDFTAVQRQDLARMLKGVTAGLDRLYQKPMPYMMTVHQAPVNGESVEDFYHFHIEFYPLLYAADKIKYRASSEEGGWAPANPSSVEETAPALRAAIERARGDGAW